MVSRLAITMCAIGLFAMASCEGSPTQPTSIVPPSAPPPSPPPAPPPPPPGPWLGFIGTEAGGFAAISGLPTMTQNFPSAVNDAGEVVGEVFLGSLRRAFIWSSEKGMEDLGVLPNAFESAATAINANGEVVGYDNPFAGNTRAFRWSRATGMTEIGRMPYTCIATQANGINNKGEIVGRCLVNSFQGITRPFLVSARGMEDLGTLDNDLGGVASAINDRGDIVGYSNPGSIYDDARGAMWNGPGKIVQIGNCSNQWCDTQANAINNDGDIAGTSNGAAFVRWHDGSLRDIGSLVGAYFTTAVGINERGEVVGVSYFSGASGKSRSFIWTASGGMREITIPGKTDVQVTDINNKGEIIGIAR